MKDDPKYDTMIQELKQLMNDNPDKFIWATMSHISQAKMQGFIYGFILALMMAGAVALLAKAI